MPFVLGTEIPLVDDYYLDDKEPLVSELSKICEKHGLSEAQFRELLKYGASLVASAYKAKGNQFIAGGDLTKISDGLKSAAAGAGLSAQQAHDFSKEAVDALASRAGLAAP